MAEAFAFARAERKQLKVKIGITGPAGSGKSYTALRLARGIVGPEGRIAIINTEKNRGEVYSTEFEYDLLNLGEPYSPERYIQAIDSAIKAGYDIVIVDSATHEWKGIGGILDSKGKMSGNDFAKWNVLTPRHDSFIEKIVTSDIHMIVTMRGKDEYVIEENEQGRQIPKKVGLGAQQRDGMEYEFHCAFQIDMQHICTASKDNTHLFDGTYRILTEEDGRAIRDWASSGAVSPLPALRRELLAILEHGRGRFDLRQTEWLTRIAATGTETELHEAAEKAEAFLANAGDDNGSRPAERAHRKGA